MEEVYLFLRLIRFLLAIVVVALILNGFLAENKGGEWYLAKKVGKTLLIFSGGFIWSDSSFFWHWLHGADVVGEQGPLWSRYVSTVIYGYGLYSCIAAFTGRKNAKPIKTL